MGLNYKNNFLHILILLWLFWCILTENLSYGNLFLGVICAFVVSWITYELFNDLAKSQPFSFRVLFRLLSFTFILLGKILKSNFQVMCLVLSPSLPINPKIVEINPALNGEFPEVILANSLTLLPATLTVEVSEEGKYYIHCLADEAEKDIKDIEKLVVNIFKEK